MAQNFIYTMQDLRKVADGREILRSVHLSFLPGAKIGVIGANGSGKSTLLRIMAGVDTEYMGQARPDPAASIGYVPQEPQLDASLDVRGNLELGLAPIRRLLDQFNAISEQFASPMDDEAMNDALAAQGVLQDQIDACNGWEIDRMLEVAIDALGLPAKDAKVETLSGGERRRVALARVLLKKPDLLLLDEPTNHLDAESVGWLEQHLKNYGGTVVCITHDRYFLDNVAEWILELDRGAGLPFKGNYTAWLEQKQKRLAVEEKTESARQRQLARELEWVRSSAKARQAKGRARLARYDELLQQSGEQNQASGEITIPPGPELRGLVLQVEDLSKSFGQRQLFENLSFRLPRGGIVGVIGANGAGKTTMFRLLLGHEKPDQGQLRWGENVKLAYVDQSRDTLDGELSVYDAVADGVEYLELGARKMNARAYVAGFAFKGSDQQKKVKNLSGGERNRVHLARTLKQGGNVLLLDEPTNDLDVETLRSLEEGLIEFAGCAVVISHDRWFLDRIATHMLAFEGHGQVTFFAGNFQDYEADKIKRQGAASQDTKKVRYRPIARV